MDGASVRYGRATTEQERRPHPSPWHTGAMTTGLRLPTVEEVRGRLGAALFLRVAGPDGAHHRDRIHHTPGPRWFDGDSPIARVHGDAAMFVGGIRALLLQSLHPAAMRAVSEHSRRDAPRRPCAPSPTRE